MRQMRHRTRTPFSKGPHGITPAMVGQTAPGKSSRSAVTADTSLVVSGEPLPRH
jgi:hypothetical protein